jgi:hypothetical protein
MHSKTVRAGRILPPWADAPARRQSRPRAQPGSNLPVRCCFAALLLVVQAMAAQGDQGEACVPYATGSHLQLVRNFFTAADGLPADDVQAAVATRDRIVLVATGKGLARQEGERWVNVGGLSGVSALYAPARGPSAMAGATNGIWALNDGQWQLEEGSPAGVMAFSAEPDGTPWAMAPSGVWRREKTWRLVQSLEDDVLAQPHGLLPVGSNDVFVAAESGLFARA